MGTARDRTVYCPDCGSEISAQAEVCPDCGAAQRTGPANRTPTGPTNQASAGTMNETPAGTTKQAPGGPANETPTGTANQAPAEPMGRVGAALVGAAVSLFVGWFPLVGPAFGGIAAGYLRGDDVTESALTGTLGNVIASIPLLLLALLFIGLGTIGAIVEGNGDAGLGLVIWLIVFAISFAYFYGLGALGGVLGAKITDRGTPR